ncbi:hypothetical protein [Cesiribacter andamanensis]
MEYRPCRILGACNLLLSRAYRKKLYATSN